MRPILLLVVAAAALSAAPLAADDRPNVVLVLADDLGRGDLSCYGGKTRTSTTS